MIKLKKLSKKDLEYRVNLLNDKEIAPYVNTNEKFTIEKTIVWFENVENNSKRTDFTFNDEDDIIGMGGLIDISKENLNCELYMYLDPSFQGKGYGYKSCVALCDYAFSKLGLNKVLLYTFAKNERANNLYEKVGFKKEGVLREQTKKEGFLQDRFIYGLLKREFKK